jgi:type I restriction enzyme S subunit
MAVKKKEDSLTMEDKLKAALVPEVEQLYPIPENWVWCTLNNILNIKYGKGLKKENRKDGDIPVYGSNGIVGFHDEPLTKGPTIIIGRKGSVGEVHYSQTKCWPIDTTYYIDDLFMIEYTFLFYLLGNLKLGQLDKSTAIPGINRNELYSVNVPLPPLPEQQRIAEKLESLLEKIKEVKTLLDEIPEILQNFRQSVLAAACSGRLTEDWPEHADFLSKNLREIATWSSGGTPSRAHPEYYGGSIPWIKTGELRENIIVDTEERLTQLGLEKSSAKLFPIGTVLVAMYGATIGRVALLGIDAATNQACAAAIPIAERVKSRYLFYLLQAQKDALVKKGQGGAQPNISQGLIKEHQILLPTLQEQQEIVRRVESLFSKADDLEAQYKEALELIESLPEIILSKAFRGALVPQDPTDEPAIKLLESIIKEQSIPDVAKGLIKEVAVAKEKVTVRKRIPLMDVLRETNNWISSYDLLLKAGYPVDADPDTIEDFYLKLKEEMKAAPPRIQRERRDNIDYFRAI